MSAAPRGSGSATRTLRFCASSELAAGCALSRSIDGRAIAVARLPGGALAAFGALCPHQHADLSLGLLDATGITCADHLWRFDLPSGVCTSIPGARLPSYGVREEAGCVAIDAYRSTRDPRRFYIHSRWADEAAFEIHAGLPRTAQFLERVRPLIDHPLDVTRARPVGAR